MRRRFRWVSVLYLGVVWGRGVQVDPWLRLPVFVSSEARIPWVHLEDTVEAAAIALEKGSGEFLVATELALPREPGRVLGKRIFLPPGLLKALGGTASFFLEALGVFPPLNRWALSWPSPTGPSTRAG